MIHLLEGYEDPRHVELKMLTLVESALMLHHLVLRLGFRYSMN